jgi:tetratricopeptide (TPR) repeat protein
MSLILTQQTDLALEHFTLGNEVLRKLLPDIHPDIAKSFIGIGYTYYMQQNLIDAKTFFQMAFTIQKQSLIYNHPDFAKTRNGLAHCLSCDKQTVKQALNELEYALNILLDTFQHDYQHHPEVVATRNDIEKLRKGKELRPRNTLLDYI